MNVLYLKCVCIVLFCCLAIPTFAQKRVTDQSGQPLPGVSVTEKGVKNGTSTNANGGFSINVKEGSILIFTSVDLVTKELTAGAESQINVSLSEAAQSLGEVVVTALGIKKEKRQLGFAIKGADVASTNEVNHISALQGKATGGNIDQSAGSLPGNARIVIRGNSTFGTNNQLQ